MENPSTDDHKQPDSEAPADVASRRSHERIRASKRRLLPPMVDRPNP
jgi:hypothetical protein